MALGTLATWWRSEVADTQNRRNLAVHGHGCHRFVMVWGPLSDDEYRVIKAVLEEIDKAEANFGRLFREHPLQQIQEIDDMRTMMRAAVEGYEAAHKGA